jgi:hypothetical protein
MKASSGEGYVSETCGSSRDHGDTTTSSDDGGPKRFPGTTASPIAIRTTATATSGPSPGWFGACF